MVKLLWFLSQLTWIPRCISHSNLMFQNFIWKSVAGTVKRFGFLTLKEWEWLNGCPKYFDSNHNLPEFWCLDAFPPLIWFSKVLSEECCSNGSEIWFLVRSRKKRSFRQILAPEDIACQWMLLSLLAQSGWG